MPKYSIEQVYSISEVVALSGTGQTKIYKEIAKGKLRASKIGNRTLITKSDYEGWIDNLPHFLEDLANEPSTTPWAPPQWPTKLEAK